MKIIFMGTPDAAVPSLAGCVKGGHQVVAVWTQPDRPAGRGNRLTPPPVKEFALAHGIEVQQPLKIRNAESVALFESYRADVAVVVAYGRILPEPILRATRLGCLNVHFSLLPTYRGAAPVNWAIVRGERETGVTTMQMDAGLDTGPILLQDRTEIGREETAPELMTRLSVMGADLLRRTLANLNEIVPRAQEEDKATFAPILNREDGLIEWVLDSEQIEKRVRGFQPWPNAYTIFDSRRLIIWRAQHLPPALSNSAPALPGEVIEARGDSLIVACGEGTLLRVLELQPEGKRRMNVRDFLNGTRLTAGARFG
jgi:methionyl-tRNA formyltransferase